MSKVLKVYSADTFYTYTGLYKKFFFRVCEDKVLSVFKVSPIDGAESLVAVFRNWDYFCIDEQ